MGEEGVQHRGRLVCPEHADQVGVIDSDEYLARSYRQRYDYCGACLVTLTADNLHVDGLPDDHAHSRWCEDCWSVQATDEVRARWSAIVAEDVARSEP